MQWSSVNTWNFQHAKKVKSDSPGLVIFVLNLPERHVLFFREIQSTEGLTVINPTNQKGFCFEAS